jgi:hypothetical protein
MFLPLKTSIGMLEEWTDGMMGSYSLLLENYIFFHIIPLFQYSIGF